MLSVSRNLRFACCVALVFVFVLTYCQLYDVYSRLSIQNRLGNYHKHDIVLSKEEFVVTTIEAARGDHYDDTSIRQLCSAQNWDNSVVFTCHGLIGGIGKQTLSSSFPSLLKHILIFQF